MSDFTSLPADLPVPQDDGAAAHLPGMRMPHLTLQATDGTEVQLDALWEGRTVIYLYPLTGRPGVDLPEGWDSIPGARGCSTEACDFRDSLNSLKSAGYTVVGVSRDEPEKLAEFVKRDGLNFTLLSDPDRAAHELYGVWGEKSMYGKTVVGVIRSTFVIDENGVITLPLYNVKATGHVASLRKKLGLAA